MNGSDQLIEALFDGCAFTIAITEASRMEVLAQKYKLHELDLKKLAAIDPTSILTPEGEVKKIGGYTGWIIRQYLKKKTPGEKYRFMHEDAARLKEDLTIFARNKARLKDDHKDLNRFPDDVYLAQERLEELKHRLESEKGQAPTAPGTDGEKKYKVGDIHTNDEGQSYRFTGQHWVPIAKPDSTPEEVSQMAEGLIERIIGYSDLYRQGANSSMEHVVAAAWQSPGENIYAGDSHHDAFKEAVADGNAEAIQASKMPVWREAIQSMGWRDGFVTNTDRWITRQEALALGRKQKQFTVQPLKGSVAVGAASEYFR